VHRSHEVYPQVEESTGIGFCANIADESYTVDYSAYYRPVMFAGRTKMWFWQKKFPWQHGFNLKRIFGF